jgi:hypothetical protein
MSVGRVNPKLPAWVGRHTPKDSSAEEYQYLDVLKLPAELHPLSVGVFPIDFRDKNFIRNMDLVYPTVPDAWRLFGLLPFPVYRDTLSMMIRNAEPLPPLLDRKEPLDASTDAGKEVIEKHHIHRGTCCLYDVYTNCLAALIWLKMHTGMRENQEWAASANQSFALYENRLKRRKELFLQVTQSLPGAYKLLFDMQEPGSHITSFYSEELARAFEPLAYRYAVSVIRVMQECIVEIIGLDAQKAQEHQLFISQDRPPLEHIAPAVAASIKVHSEQFLTNFGAGSKDGSPCFDSDHAEEVSKTTPAGAVNPSFLFQVLVQILLDKVSVKQQKSRPAEETPAAPVSVPAFSDPVAPIAITAQ